MVGHKFEANLDSRKNREIEACVLTCTVRSLVGPLRLEAFLPSLGLRGQFGGDLLLHDRRFVHLVGGADQALPLLLHGARGLPQPLQVLLVVFPLLLQLGLLPAELLLPFSARLLPLLHLRLQTFDLYPLPLPLLLPALLLVLMLSLQLVQVGHLGPLFLQVALLLLLQQHVAVVTSGLLAAGLESAEQLDLAVLLDDNYLYNEYKHTITSRMRVVQVIRSSLEPVWISYISGRLVGPEVVLVHSPTPGLRLQGTRSFQQLLILSDTYSDQLTFYIDGLGQGGRQKRRGVLRGELQPQAIHVIHRPWSFLVTLEKTQRRNDLIKPRGLEEKLQLFIV
ncbi:hypothetical protein INR49_013207 [Caranx melampygus]|nr:hypothetical protein INR49_013207 [Caranx melampygus]